MEFLFAKQQIRRCQYYWDGKSVNLQRLPKIVSKLSLYALLSGVAVLAVWLRLRTQTINFEHHGRCTANLRRIQELDARINQNVLQVRDGILTNYDPIVSDISELKLLQADLKQIPNFVDRLNRDELNQLLQSYDRRYQEALNHSQTYRLSLYLLSIVVLISIATSIIYRLRTFALATKEAEASLQASEEELQKSEKQLRALLYAIPDRMFRHRIDGTYLDFKARSEELLFPAESLIGTKLSDLDLPPKVVDDLLERFQLAVDSGEPQTYEHELNRPTGTYSYEARIVKSGVDEVVCIVRDITARKRAEEALQEAMKAAEIANLAKSRFLSNMSHELRTPLNVILGFAQLAIRNTSLTAQQQEYMDTINRSGEHLLKLINDVLEISKIEAGKTTLNESNFDLHALMSWLQQMLRIKSESKGLQLIFDLSTNLPRYVFTDESKLSQICMNLLSNAIKFTQTGSVTLRASSPHPSILHFEVEDTGSGIDASEIDVLFEPFVQTEVGRNSQEGTGLGLAISREFIRLMGGEITVESKLSQGTKFEFDIRIAPVDTNTIQAYQPVQQVIGLEAGQSPYRILIAEDKPENRLLLVEMLKPIGFEVQEATNGREAISIWQSWNPHLIWMDMHMPMIDGYEAARQIKASGDRAPIIVALTGSAFEKDRIAALSAGCDDFVHKPVRSQTIFDKMAKHLDVRYLYGSKQLSSGIIESQQNLCYPQLSSDEIKQALAEMPVDWVQKLHQAAIRVNGKQILELIDRMPQPNHRLADTLAHLVDNFYFEEIISSTQP